VALHALPDETQLAELVASHTVRALRASEARPHPWWVLAARSADLLPGLRIRDLGTRDVYKYAGTSANRRKVVTVTKPSRW
jgi:hypothetical protein